MPSRAKAYFKKYGSVLYIALMSIAVVWVILSNNEISAITEAMGRMHGKWVACAIGCIVLYFFFRSAVLWYFARRNRHPISVFQALSANAVGQFYSAITPSASGGQPTQVIRLHRYGMPVSLATACVSVEFIGFQASYLLLGAIAWIFESGYLSRQIDGFGWLVLLGYFVNSVLILLIFLAAINYKRLQKLIHGVIHFLTRTRLIKNEQNLCGKADHTIRDFRDSLFTLIRSPLDALVIILISIGEIISYMSVPVFMALAFDLTTTSVVHIVATQLMLFIAAAFIPLPGSAGAQESGFCYFYRNIFTADTLVPAMLCWRFLTYYLQMILSLLLMVIDNILMSKTNNSK